jgi:hypothetical protein
MQLREVAAISGRPGLFQILKPTHGGVIVEALDNTRAREAVGASQRLSILSEISMYTTEGEGSEPLGNIFAAIFEKYNGKKLALTAKSDGADLEAFYGEVLPTWDRDRVYLSDIKKLVTWYNILVERAPEVLQPQKDEEAPKAEEVPVVEAAVEEAKPAKAKKAKAEVAVEVPATAEAEASVTVEEEAPKKKAAPKKKKEGDA